MVFATKIDLAAELEISRATVQNFFAGKPIGRENFHKICQTLKLPWHEIADLTEEIDIDEEKEISDDRDCPVPDPHLGDDDFVNPKFAPLHLPESDWIQLLRQQIQVVVRQQCGSLRVLDMSRPRPVSEIYTEVRLFKKISSRRRLDISDLVKASTIAKLDRPLPQYNSRETLLGFQAVGQITKLMILGRPGTGKTTFLKQIAIQCISGQCFSDRVPIFVFLRDFSEVAARQSLLTYITNQLTITGVVDAQLLLDVLIQGKALLLLDGLDEVTWSDRSQVLQAIRQFVTQFHANHFVITCRTAAQDYIFEQFTEVEIADFDGSQIASFATKWFAAKDSTLAPRFIQALYANRSILELATNPILLTLLCLIFEDSGSFPTNRSILYKEALQVLLKTWDASRYIDRSEACRAFSLTHQEELLSQIALLTLEQGNYFFRRTEIGQVFCDHSYPSQGSQFEDQIDHEAILKCIEAQHGLLVERARGIYSFSHCIFHKYFAARGILAQVGDSAIETALSRLADQITNCHWHEVFLLTAEMLPRPQRWFQLMVQKIAQIAQDPGLHNFLSWLAQKTTSVSATGQSAALRALYFELELSQILDLAHYPHLLSHTLDFDGSLTAMQQPNTPLRLDQLLARVLILSDTLSCNLECEQELPPALLTQARSLMHSFALAYNCSVSIASDIASNLQQLKSQFPNLNQYVDLRQNKLQFQNWWRTNGVGWTEQLRAAIINHCNFCHIWQFDLQQKILLKQYYQANQLLVECLNHADFPTETRFQTIESLLLPSAELGNLQPHHA